MAKTQGEEWPVEIRELHERIIRAASADEGVGDLEADLEHLRGLAQQKEDRLAMKAARLALFDVLLKFVPEEMARHMFRDRGQAAIELATSILLAADPDDEAREKAEHLLSLMAEKFPPRGRA